MGEIKIGDKVLVEMNVVGWDKITGDYQMRPRGDTRTFWASKENVHPLPAKTYEDGLREAWELAKKLFLYPHEGGYNSTELEEIFGRTEHLWELSPQEAAAKIVEWEGKKEIHVGDVVKDLTLKKGYAVVSGVGGGSMCYVIWNDGSCGEHDKDNFVKTGRTIDIAWLLEQIGGAE